jgi:hypothetical protein
MPLAPPKASQAQAPPKEETPKESFFTRTSDEFEVIVPFYSAAAVGVRGLFLGFSLGEPLGRFGYAVAGAAGLLGGLAVGNMIGQQAVSFSGDLGAHLDTENPARGMAITQAATAGAFGAVVGGAVPAVFLVGAGIGMAGVETGLSKIFGP